MGIHNECANVRAKWFNAEINHPQPDSTLAFMYFAFWCQWNQLIDKQRKRDAVPAWQRRYNDEQLRAIRLRADD